MHNRKACRVIPGTHYTRKVKKGSGNVTWFAEEPYVIIEYITGKNRVDVAVADIYEPSEPNLSPSARATRRIGI